jgi:hypothetical protein
LRNLTAPDFGEAQMMIELLACGNESLRRTRTITDQTIFVIRVISSYVTFIRVRLVQSIGKKLGEVYHVKVLRWPIGNDPVTGLNLAEPAGRQEILTALVKIRQSILAGSSTTTASAEQSTTTASQNQTEPSGKSEGKKPAK